MMRTILFIQYDPKRNELCTLVKRIPYAPEDAEMYFVDISLADKEKLGVGDLKYLNNHYSDDQPYVWLNQPSHVASCSMPLKYMYLQLLKTMQKKFQEQLEILDGILTTYDRENIMWQRGYLPGFETTRMRGCSTVSGKWKILGKIHLFSVPADRNAPTALCKMLRQVWQEMRQEVIQLNAVYHAVLRMIDRKAEDICSDSIPE